MNSTETKTPNHFEISEGSSYYHSTVIDYYRAEYFEAIDLIVGGVKDHFDQPGYKVYSKLEKLLLNAANK